MDTKQRIEYLRKKILVHSYIYYALNDNIITDETWSRWAKELEQLQKDNPEIASDSFLSDVFKSFDHSTGANLDYSNCDWVHGKALQLIRYAYEHK